MTIHRAYGHVDRASLTDDGPVRVVMASEGKMADGIDLRMSGADLARFRANPVLGYGHSYHGRTNLPIGRVLPETITVKNTSLVGDLEFDQGDEFAREVERKLRGGYLNAVSTGFDVLQWESADDNYWRGGVATKWEQSELSVVPIGMDPNALVTARELADQDDRAFAWLLDQLARRGAVTIPPAPTAPVEDKPIDPAPPASGVPEDAARGFLAAFTKERHA